MNSLNGKTFGILKTGLKLSPLYVFLCDKVYAAPIVEPGKKLIDMLFRNEMIFLIVLALFIVGLLIKLNYRKVVKDKKKELDNMVVKNDENNIIRREEFKKLEAKYDEIRNQSNLKKEARKDNEEDYDKTMVLSKIELDITLEELQKRAEAREKAKEVHEEDPEVSEVQVEVTENKVVDINDENVTLKDINEELRQEREDLDAEKATKQEVEEADEFYNVRRIGKNVKNVIDKALELKRRQILDYATAINTSMVGVEDYKTVINTFVDDYIDVKYRRQCEHQCKNAKTLKKLVNNEMEKTRIKLTKEVNRSYSDNYVRLVFEIFMIINNIDNMDVNNIEKHINENVTLNILDKEVLVKRLNKIYKTYYNIYFDYLNKLTVDKFELINNRKVDTGGLFEQGDLVFTNVASTIQFSKIFSDYIIDKTYNSDVILEDIREVQLKLVSFCILDDLLKFNHKKKYVINFPTSIFKKERKVRTVLNAVSDGYSQSKVFILIDIETLKYSLPVLIKLKQEGYKFIVQVGADNIKLYDKLKESLSVADYLVYVGPRISKSIMKEFIPSYLLKKIIYTDKSLLEGVVVK